MNWDRADLAKLARIGAEDRIRWAVRRYRDGALATSSFGADSAVLLHLISRVAPRLKVVFLDTGFHFAETLQYKTSLQDRFDLNVQVARPQMERAEFEGKYGKAYRSDPDFCCGCNKVEPMQRVLAGAQCWITGLRRGQTAHRRNLPVLERQADGLAKLNPLIDWTEEQVREYIRRHGLPAHPLAEAGYTSIGCEPCTAKPRPDGNTRSGRWAGRDKTECGLHTAYAPQQSAAEGTAG